MVHLKRAVQRPTRPFAPVNNILCSREAGSKYFVTLHCITGYWQIVLALKSQKLVAVLTEWGGMTYLRAPMGPTSTGDVFCHWTDSALAGLPGVHKLVDDVLVTGKTKKELMEQVFRVFEACLANGIMLSAVKAQVGQTVKFAGFVVDHEGTLPDQEKVQALRDFPVPKDLTNLKSYLGLANQLGEFAPYLKHTLEPLKPLLSSKNAYA